MDIIVLRTKRKTVSLRVSREGQVVVRAPRWVGETELGNIIVKKRAWIQKHIQRTKTVLETKKKFEPGESYLFLGSSYGLKISDDYFRTIKQEDNSLVVSRFFKHKTPGLLEFWYRREAERIFLERTKYYASLFGFSLQALRVTGARTRWGSCSGKGTVSFSWRLVQLPLWVVDYVIIHELVHTKHHNHGPAFWNLVGKCFPEYLNAKLILKNFEHTW